MRHTLIALAGALLCASASSAIASSSPAPNEAAALTIQTNASHRTVNRGGSLTFAIAVTNHTPAVVQEVTICDRLPAAVGRVTRTGGLHLFDTTACRTLRSMPANATVTIDLAVKIAVQARLGCNRDTAVVTWAGHRARSTASYLITPSRHAR